MEQLIRKLLKRGTILDYYEGMDDFLDESELFDELIFMENLEAMDDTYEMNYEKRKQFEYISEFSDELEKRAV